MIERAKMIIYTSNLRNIRGLRPFAHLIYYSQIFHYAVVFVNATDVDRIKDRLEKSRKIERVEVVATTGETC
jgi:uncharacterized protein YlbG (UPF0298 family)